MINYRIINYISIHLAGYMRLFWLPFFYLDRKKEANEWPGNSLTASVERRLPQLKLRLLAAGRSGLQLPELLHQQGQVLQQVTVLQEQLVRARLRLHAGAALGRHLILQQLHLPRTETNSQSVQRGNIRINRQFEIYTNEAQQRDQLLLIC